ncbi:hypothetical protein [Nitrosovibrio sp. Nv6]|uniref:hypothetical protein n=1 Tax=Nitrosovibrio sp. Nv6 TaxID=1855340 RepID=UPI0008AFBEF9|nr:hypothetical protein [Nitrosovibrio sp. Nv6]SEO83700.1 hypothetical protein SAMN05216316_1227 [Nitrosovibrio sp. Nv6]
MKFIVPALLVVLISGIAQADPPQLRDRQTGKYLGNLSANPHDPNSVSNPYGRYGSEHSQDSINNPQGQYGSRYSNDSANNPYATNAPAIHGNDKYNPGYRY